MKRKVTQLYQFNIDTFSTSLLLRYFHRIIFLDFYTSFQSCRQSGQTARLQSLPIRLKDR